MPIWTQILIILYTSLVGSIFGGLATFGIFFGNKAFFSKMMKTWNSNKEEEPEEEEEQGDKK